MYAELFDPIIARYGRCLKAARGVRRPGSAALDLCYVACGRFDGFWEQNLKPWDSAAGFNIIDSPDYPDTTYDFTRKMESTLNAGTSAAIRSDIKFKIHTPLMNKTKSEIIKMGLELKADYSHTISCYRGKETPCMSCPACDIRQSAFLELGLKDPLIARLEGET